MKRAFAVGLLLMSLGSVALADGGFPPPTGTTTKPNKPSFLLSDGGFPPPVGTPTKPSKSGTIA